MDRDLEARALQVRDLEGEGVMEPEAQARDSGEGRLIMQGGSRLKKTADFCHTEDSRETV
jgi:hypothetical protein